MYDRNFNYHEQILYISCFLCTLYRDLHLCGLNASLFNELKDLRGLFEEGEEFPADIALLEALEDKNIKILLSGMNAILESGESLLNLNNISEDRFSVAFEDGLGSEYSADFEEQEDMGYDYWIQAAVGYLHYNVFNLLSFSYCLTHGTAEVPKEHEADLYFPTDSSLSLLDNEDTNVKILTDLAFKLSEYAGELSEKNDKVEK